VNWTGNTPPEILITPQAFQKLRLYIDLCPMEIGGLGEVERDGHRFLITATFLGLYGVSSPLPTFYTEDLMDEASQDIANLSAKIRGQIG